MRQRVMIGDWRFLHPQPLDCRRADDGARRDDSGGKSSSGFKRLRDELGMAIIWIKHDLGIVAGLAQRVLVMYAAFIIEEAQVKDLYADPRHPYTLGLLAACPRGPDAASPSVSIDGLPPDLVGLPRAARLPRGVSLRWIAAGKENPVLESVSPAPRKAVGGTLPGEPAVSDDNILLQVVTLRSIFPNHAGHIFMKRVRQRQKRWMASR